MKSKSLSENYEPLSLLFASLDSPTSTAASALRGLFGSARAVVVGLVKPGLSANSVACSALS